MLDALGTTDKADSILFTADVRLVLSVALISPGRDVVAVEMVIVFSVRPLCLMVMTPVLLA